jgi:hypothetical protein
MSDDVLARMDELIKQYSKLSEKRGNGAEPLSDVELRFWLDRSTKHFNEFDKWSSDQLNVMVSQFLGDDPFRVEWPDGSINYAGTLGGEVIALALYLRMYLRMQSTLHGSKSLIAGVRERMARGEVVGRGRSDDEED